MRWVGKNRRRRRHAWCEAVALGWLALAGPMRAAEENPLLGQPVVGKNADGVLEVFCVNRDGELRHRWQKPANGDWSSWASLGGSVYPGIAILTNADGRLQVFAVDRGRHELWQIAQQVANQPEWTAWASLGGSVRPPVAAGQNAQGLLELFALDAASGAVRHLRQTNSPGGWSAWDTLGGNLAPALTVARNRDGRLELFGADVGDQTLVHCWQCPATEAGYWSEWTSLGGAVLPGFAVGQNVLGQLEVFAVHPGDGRVCRTYQLAPNTTSAWSPWQDFGAQVQTGLAVGPSADGRLELLAVDRQTSALLHRWEILNTGADVWSAWTDLGQTAQPYPAVGQNEDGNLEVFAVDKENPNALNHRRQISHSSGWLDWSSLDHSTFPYLARTWQTDEGLPHNVVQAIAQTRDGYLWVGTGGGLARFDGLAFTPFDLHTPALDNASITALCADRQGALWIGTDGGGVTRFGAGRLAHFGRTNGLAGDFLQAIYQGRDGSLWFATTTGMSRYERGQFTNYTTREGLLSDVVRALYEDREGDLWIATGGGLNRLHGGRMESFEMPNELPNDSVRCICQDHGGRIWIGSNNGMLWYNWYWVRNFYAYNTKYGLTDPFVSAICEDREGNLWVGTYSGLNRFREGRFFTEHDGEGAPFDKVNALFEDRQGDLWVGSRQGLTRLTPNRFRTYTRRQGLTHNNVRSVLEDRTGGLWVGTWGGGLNRLKDERVTAYNLSQGPTAKPAGPGATTNMLAESLVLALAEGRDGSLWVGYDFDGGLTHLKDGASTHYSHADGLPQAPVRVLHEDRAGNLWVGTDGGLCRFRAGRFTSCTNYSLAGQPVRAIGEDSAGTLWFGTAGGLVSCQAGQFQTFTTRDGLADNDITALYEDAQHTLWLGTSHGGLNRMSLAPRPPSKVQSPTARFTNYTTRQGLFSDEILEILEDDAGWLWLSSSRGIFRVRKQNLDDVAEGKSQVVASLVYGKLDGLETTQCSSGGKPAGWKSRDGRLWFATSKGLVVVAPNTLPVDFLPAPVHLEQLVADRKLVWDATRGAPNQPAPAPYAAPFVRLPPGRGELEFCYTALDLQLPEVCRFKYQLEGIDAEWLDAGTRRRAYYNNVAPGHYCFRVIARNRDGVWNASGAALVVELRPHYWQTWWWRGSLALAAIGTASGSARYVTRKRMQRKLRLLEQRHALEQERGRIAKDIHDDLGSSLTRIMLLGERAEEGLAGQEDVGVHVRKIVASARATVQALDEIVWAVNPENDTLEGLLQYISHYADEFFENTSVGCRLEMPMKLPGFVLPAEVRHDLFLVVKEAFNNILKHADASAVRVEVSTAGAMLRIVIADNGRGFNPGPATSGRRGNGLGNMRKRMASLGGRLDLRTAPGQGTELTLTAPLKTLE